jgi:hypothetical protein
MSVQRPMINNDQKAHIMLMNDHYYIVEYLDYDTSVSNVDNKYNLRKGST